MYCPLPAGAGASAAGKAAPLEAIFERPRDESAEEKKLRKALVKETKRAARANKKDLKDLYRTEASRQHKATAHAVKGTTFIIG